MTLHRYWLRFNLEGYANPPAGIRAGCGVTAYDLADAMELLAATVFGGRPLPPAQEIIEDVDVSTLDANHVLPNMGVPVSRGIWFPAQ